MNENHLTSFKILKGGDYDASSSIPVQFTVDSPTNPICNVTFLLESKKESWDDVFFDPYNDEGWESGTYTVNVLIENKLKIGEYTLKMVESTAMNEFRLYSYSREKYPEFYQIDTINIIKSERKETIDPKLIDYTISKNVLNTPDTVTFTIEANENGVLLTSVSFDYTAQNGRKFWIGASIAKKDRISPGNYKVKACMEPFEAEGPARLTRINIENGTELSHAVVNKDDSESEFWTKGDITLNSGYNIKYFGATGNARAVAEIKKLNDGEAAVLDCRNIKIAKAERFKAIAGRDITLAFINNDVQWVFDGEDVSLSKCKDINLKSNIKIVPGAPYGFSDDKKVVLLEFAENGELPGEVEMRINSEYIQTKYDLDTEGVFISYVTEQNITIEEDNVETAEDEYYEFDVDHNSTFAMSEEKARIGAPTVSSRSVGFKAIKLTWSKTAGNGYYVYKSTKKNGKYKKLATVKSSKRLYYTDKKVKKGKTYYYKVKPFAKKAALNKTAKTSKIYKTTPRLKCPAPWISPSPAKTIDVEWNKLSGAKKYVVYRRVGETGSYVKIGSTTKIHFRNKGVKPNIAYYYKVKALHETAKYSSDLSYSVCGATR